MSFSTLQEFFAMGGHGLYVWLSYGAAVLVILVNVVSVRRATRRHRQGTADLLRRHAASQPSQKMNSGQP